MASRWATGDHLALHANGAGAAVAVTTTTAAVDWNTVTLAGANAWYEFDARSGNVQLTIPQNPGVAHNGKRILLTVNDLDTTQNFRGVAFTGGNPVRTAGLTAAKSFYSLNPGSRMAIEIRNGVAVMTAQGAFDTSPVLPTDAALLAIAAGWVTGGTAAYIAGTDDILVSFLVDGSFNPTKALAARVLGVGGGGAGGWDHAGGGGGGFASDIASQAISAGTHAVTIGGGGTAQTSGTTPNTGAKGGNTLLGALFTWQGGGSGGGRAGLTSGNGLPSTSGGPGGGAAGSGTGSTAGTNPKGAAAGTQGFAGGDGTNQSSNAGNGGGGGGAGGVGGNATAGNTSGAGGSSGDGGIGVQNNITGTLVGYGGGAPGGRWLDGTLGTNAPGGVNYGAGVGEGATAVTLNAQNGLANRGGGGGGGGDGLKAGGNGGSGVLYLRFNKAAAVI